MSIAGILIALLFLFLLAFTAHWVISKFFPEPLRTVALAVVGVVLLIIILSYAGGYLPTDRLVIR